MTYYAKAIGVTSLWKVPVGGGEEIKILDALANCFNYAVTGKGIYFNPPPDATGGSSIQFLDLSTGKTQLIAGIEKPVSYGLAVSPDYRTILYSQFERRRDLMLVENFR